MMETIEQVPQKLLDAPAPDYTRITATLPLESVHPGELLRMAMTSGRDIDTIERLMGLQDRHEATIARKAFNAAMAQFHAVHIKVVRTSTVKQGPMAGMQYARLSDFTQAIAEPLATAGLSVSWKLLQDAKDWLEVACVVRHVLGHQEETRMSGPPDQTGGKNSIQARASAVSYLEKYTLKMALGLAEQNDDDDGNGDGTGGAGDTGKRPDDTGRPAGATPPNEPRGAPPPCPDDYFKRNLPEWRNLVAQGKDPERIIAKVSTRYALSEKQMEAIKAKEAA